jgi:hypothetical protein
MINYRDFITVDDINLFVIGDISIINIESIPYNDKPSYFYRVWFRR